MDTWDVQLCTFHEFLTGGCASGILMTSCSSHIANHTNSYVNEITHTA